MSWPGFRYSPRLHLSALCHGGISHSVITRRATYRTIALQGLTLRPGIGARPAVVSRAAQPAGHEGPVTGSAVNIVCLPLDQSSRVTPKVEARPPSMGGRIRGSEPIQPSILTTLS